MSFKIKTRREHVLYRGEIESVVTCFGTKHIISLKDKEN